MRWRFGASGAEKPRVLGAIERFCAAAQLHRQVPRLSRSLPLRSIAATTSRSLPMATVILRTLLGATACATAGELKLISAGHTGCTPEQLTVSNVRNLGTIWNATCNGKTYLCSRNSSGNSCALAQ
jgi:hypothetical protein